MSPRTLGGPLGLSAFSLRMAAGAVLACLAWTAGARAADETVTWTCRHTAAFTVLETVNPRSAGMLFVTRRSAGPVKADCMIETRATDIVIGDDDALYYIALQGKMLVLDAGTSPDRQVKVFDLATGKAILEASYAIAESQNCDPASGCRSEEFKVDDTGVTFWRTVKERATVRNCPAFAKITSSSLEPVLQERTSFTFATLKAENLKARRCVPSQGGYPGGYRINGVPQD